jgi:uncharacterized protein (DUF433 family)
MKSELLQRITIEPGKRGGRPILEDYPFLERDDILAAIEYAARQTDQVVLQAS